MTRRIRRDSALSCCLGVCVFTLSFGSCRVSCYEQKVKGSVQKRIDDKKTEVCSGVGF
jgi:hypothetical protein